MLERAGKAAGGGGGSSSSLNALSSPIAMSPTSLCYDSVEGANLFATTERSRAQAHDAALSASQPSARRASQSSSTSSHPPSRSASSPRVRSSGSSPPLGRVLRSGCRTQHSSEVDKTYRLMRRTTNVLRSSSPRRQPHGKGVAGRGVAGEASSSSRFGSGWGSPLGPGSTRPRPGSAAAPCGTPNEHPNALTRGGGFGVEAQQRRSEAQGSSRSLTPLSEASVNSVSQADTLPSFGSMASMAAPEQMRPEVAPEIALETIAQHLRPCSLSLLLITAAFGPYDAFEFGGDDFDEPLDGTRSLPQLLLLRYCACVPCCLLAVGVVHVQLRHGLRDKTHMQSLGCGLMLVASICFFVLVLAAPNEPPRPMWAIAMLVVHQWFMYTVLALEVVPQAALTLVLSAVGGFLVWWVQLSAVASGAQTHDHHAAEESAGAAGGHVGAHGAEGSTEYNSALIALVSWSLVFHALGLRHTLRRRAGLLRHAQHRQRSTVCAEHIMEEVEACKKLLENIFPPQVLSELQLNMRLGASERAAVVAQEFEGCTFLFAKLVGLRHLVESADPRWLLELLQTTFDTFDTLAETFSVQRVRKTVNESYMVAAGLPDPTLLRSPVDRALATAGFGLALCGVMDVLNAQMAQRMGGGGKGTADGRRRGSGGAPPTLDVQVGVNSGSAIAGVIGHRRIQYDLVGDAVNTAARMCSYGAPGRVHVSAATYEHLAPHYLATSRGPLQIKGKGLMTTYFLERRCDADAATSAASSAAPSAAPPAESPPHEQPREAVRAAAASKAREAAMAAAGAVTAAIEAATAAEAEARALEQAVADGGEGSSSGAAGPPEATDEAMPNGGYHGD